MILLSNIHFLFIKFIILATILLFSDKFYLACTCTMETLQHPVIVTPTIFVILLGLQLQQIRFKITLVSKQSDASLFGPCCFVDTAPPVSRSSHLACQIISSHTQPDKCDKCRRNSRLDCPKSLGPEIYNNIIPHKNTLIKLSVSLLCLVYFSSWFMLSCMSQATFLKVNCL